METEDLMARKWLRDVLLWCIPLVLAPGCNHFPAVGSAVGDDARLRGVSTSAPGSNADAAYPLPGKKVFSAAVAQEPVIHTETRKQADPPADIVRGQLPSPPSPAKPLVLPKAPQPGPASPTGVVNKPIALGRPGVVTFEDAAEPLGPLAAGSQTGPPRGLPQLPAVESKKSDRRDYEHFMNALRCMLAGKHQEAIQYLRKYDQETEEFFLRLAPTLITLVKTPIDELSPPEVALLSDQLSGILAMLRPRSELRVNKMCYCRRIHTFGLADPLPDNHAFVAGTADRPGELVQLYAELKNFASEPAPDGDFLTKLACTLELRDNTGKTVWTYTYDRRETTHRRQTRLNDFYSNFSFYVPAIAPGAYLLTLQIADETNPELRRVARKSLDFRVTPVGVQSSSR